MDRLPIEIILTIVHEIPDLQDRLHLLQDFVDLLSESPVEWEAWRNQLSKNRIEAWIALLLAFLPNLTAISARHNRPEGWITRVVSKAAWKQPPLDANTFPALQHLESIDLTWRDLSVVMNHREYLPFFHLPSLRTLRLGPVQEPQTRYKVADHPAFLPAQGTSPVESLVLDYFCNGRYGMSDFITSCANLKRFVYQHTNNMIWASNEEEQHFAGLDASFRPWCFHAALLTQKHSLEALHLNHLGDASLPSQDGRDNGEIADANSHNRWFGSLAEFSTLRDLRIRARNLLNLQPVEREVVVLLKDILPRSLRHLHLADCNEDDYALLVPNFEDVLAQRAERFPNLQSILVSPAPREYGSFISIQQSFIKQWTSLREMCERVGVYFSIGEGEKMTLILEGKLYQFPAVSRTSHDDITNTLSMPSSSPEPFAASSSPSDSVKHHSCYTYRQFQLLRQGSTASPLRVIAHIDLDAFYAQCEMVRLQTPREQPLAVRQWDSLIAINYPARVFGITRMISAAEAKKLCPEIVLQHVATFREGEGGKWAYREDAFRNIGTDKVCLDPYRAESRKILQVMKEELSRWHADLVDDERGLGSQFQIEHASLEKASIDEVFIDLSPLVYGVLLQRYPEMRAAPQGDDKFASLPRPPTTALEWSTEDCLVDLDKTETEVDDPDWDDIAMLIGSEVVRSVRTAVWNKLQYTCSAGIARNKMMAKLGSSSNKPNKQTIVRNRAIQNFLGGFKFTKIRMLGGKLGDQVTALFGTEQVGDLLQVPLEQLRAKLDDDTALWLYGIIRGEDRSEVNPRTQIKSMLSAKSFRPSINSVEQAEKWLRIFAADIYGRLVEDGVLENRRRPKTIALHHRQNAQVRSRQHPIPGSMPIDETMLFELGKTLLRQVVGDGRAWPCANLSLSVGGFEDGVGKNQAIDSFLLRGQQAKISRASTRTPDPDGSLEGQPSEKRRKVNDDGIRRFFTKSPDDDEPKDTSPEEAIEDSTNIARLPEQSQLDAQSPATLNSYTCDRCGRLLPSHEKDEHNDWHFAKDLEVEERQAVRSSQLAERSSSNPGASSSRGKSGRGNRRKTEKGQTRLPFG
ncbi:hypothetical protein BJX96DRAFT_183757 [Aspergillus floccosus]